MTTPSRHRRIYLNTGREAEENAKEQRRSQRSEPAALAEIDARNRRTQPRPYAVLRGYAGRDLTTEELSIDPTHEIVHPTLNQFHCGTYNLNIEHGLVMIDGPLPARVWQTNRPPVRYPLTHQSDRGGHRHWAPVRPANYCTYQAGRADQTLCRCRVRVRILRALRQQEDNLDTGMPDARS